MDPRPLPRNFQAPVHVVVPSPAPSAGVAVNDPPNAANPKKRRSSGSRGVANLTPEQLAKKRANDREAQRAIRERTKTQIETLEKRIRELSSQQPYQELQTILRQKELVEAENADIKKRLNTALSLLQPLLGSQGNTDFALPSRQDASVPTNIRSNTSQPAVTPLLHTRPLPTTIAQLSDSISHRSNASPTPTFKSSPQGPQNSSPTHPLANYNTQAQLPTFPTGGIVQQTNLAHGLPDMNASGERLNLGFLLDGQNSRQPSGSPHTGQQVPAYPRLGLTIPTPSTAIQGQKLPTGYEPPAVAFSVPVRNIQATCLLDRILLDFMTERRARAAEGVSPTNLVGPAYPSVSTLLNPERSIYTHPLSKVFTDILATFPDLSELPERVAVLYVMFLIMRWQISPTQETYDRLPEWVTPRASQLFTPHPVWVDHLPWPRMRDKMVHLHPQISLDNFFVPYTTTLSLNWPYEPRDTLLGVEGSEELSINPVFETHLRDLGNWTLGVEFEKAFPMLADTCKIQRDDGRKRR